MKMFATYDERDALKFNADGSITEYNGTSNDLKTKIRHKVILCQSTPHPIGTGYEDEPCLMKVVEFNKELKDVYLDYDDGNEVLEAKLLAEGAETYKGLKEEQLEEFCMYGSFVKEIKAHEIVAVRNVAFDPEKSWTGVYKAFNWDAEK